MCCRIVIMFCLSLVLLAALGSQAEAEDRSFRLSAPDELVASGFLKFLLPRFSLKTGVRIEVVASGEDADGVLSADGAGLPVFTGLGKSWLLAGIGEANVHLERFGEWLTGDIGRKTIDSFPAKEGISFAAADPALAEDKNEEIAGDVVKGESLAVLHCGRCHMVNEQTRLSTIGSSPSFAVMRSFKDWQARFEAFFMLNPHPSFTIITDVTEPFSESRPPPIVPLEMTIDELYEILAFVSRIPPADLGAPIQYQ